MEWEIWTNWWIIFVADIQDYFEYVIKKHEIVNDDLPIRVFVNKRENRITYKIKTGYHFKLLTLETMKLIGCTKNKINNDEHFENLSHLEITEVVLVNSNIISNGYKHDLRILYTFVPKKLFGQLLNISPKISYF